MGEIFIYLGKSCILPYINTICMIYILPYNIRLKNSEYDENGILVKKYDNISIMEKDILIEPSR